MNLERGLGEVTNMRRIIPESITVVQAINISNPHKVNITKKGIYRRRE
jgi:hypothetical protein